MECTAVLRKVLFYRCLQGAFPSCQNEQLGFSTVNFIAGLFDQLIFALFNLFDDLLAGLKLSLQFRMTGNTLFLFGYLQRQGFLIVALTRQSRFQEL